MTMMNIQKTTNVFLENVDVQRLDGNAVESIMREMGHRYMSAYNTLFVRLTKLIDGVDVDIELRVHPRTGTLFIESRDLTDTQKKSVKSISGACGAEISAATKTARASLLVLDMLGWDIDMTPNVANIAAKSIFNKNGISLELRKKFATPGRTASQKSTVFSDPAEYKKLEARCEEFHPVYEQFLTSKVEIQRDLSQQWRDVWDKRKKSGKEVV